MGDGVVGGMELDGGEVGGGNGVVGGMELYEGWSCIGVEL